MKKPAKKARYRRTGVVIQEPRCVGATLTGSWRASFESSCTFALERTTPERVVDVLKGARERGELDFGQLRLVLPPEECDSFLRLCPRPSAGGLERVRADTVRWLDEEYGIETDQSDVHIATYPCKGKLAVAASLTEAGLLGRYQEALSGAGFKGSAVLSVLDAMIDMASSIPTTGVLPARAFVHVGLHDTLVLLTSDGAPVYFRAIRRELAVSAQSGDRYDAFSTERLQSAEPTLESATALAKEFSRTLQSHVIAAEDDCSLQEIVLTGCGVDVRALSVPLQDETGVPVVSLPVPKDLREPVDGSEESTIFRQEWPQLALPVSLAYARKMPPEAVLTATPSWGREFFSGKAAAFLAAAICALVLALVFVYAMLKLTDLRNEQTELQSQQQDLNREIAQRRQDYQKREEYQNATNLLLRMKLQGMQSANLLTVLNNVRPDGIGFAKVRVDVKEETCKAYLDGVIDDTPAQEALHLLNQYVLNLRASGQFDSIELEKPMLSQKRVSELRAGLLGKEASEEADRQVQAGAGTEAGSGAGADAEVDRSLFTFRLKGNVATAWNTR